MSWGDDVPDEALTSFRRAVDAKDEETVAFSWIEWPDRRHATKRRFAEDENPVPFDGKKMIYGGFGLVLEP